MHLVIYIILQILVLALFKLGYKADVSIAGIPLFFVIFCYTFLIWVVDFKSIMKYYNGALCYFILLGLYYATISLAGGFSLLSNVPSDKHYVLRQAYFLPFLFIAIPVFAQSFKVGLFKYFLQRRLFFVIFSVCLQLPISIQYTAILLLSINNHLIGLIVFSFILLIHGGVNTSSFQVLLMQGILFVFFITRKKLQLKHIITLIIIMIFTGYFIQDEIISSVAAFDANTGWRLKVWVSGIKSTINDTFFIGHGFGTTYFPSSSGRNSDEFIRFNLIQGTLREYLLPNVVHDFVRGQHNSFVNIFYRMGIFGLLLFLAYFKSIERKIRNFNAPHQLNYVLLLSMIIIGVNVGLESPGYATQFVFLIALVQYIIFEYYKTHRISEYAKWYEKREKKIEQRQLNSFD